MEVTWCEHFRFRFELNAQRHQWIKRLTKLTFRSCFAWRPEATPHDCKISVLFLILMRKVVDPLTLVERKQVHGAHGSFFFWMIYLERLYPSGNYWPLSRNFVISEKSWLISLWGYRLLCSVNFIVLIWRSSEHFTVILSFVNANGDQVLLHLP